MNEFLTVKTNALRKSASGEFTLNSAKSPDALCHACGAFSACSMRLKRKACSQFIPVLRFAVNDGFDVGAKRNTIRVGRSWYQRLTTGSRIGLWDNSEKRLLYATVNQVYWGLDKDEFLKEHAQYNHMVVAGKCAVEDFKQLLISCTGRGFYTNAKGLSAVYFTLD